MEAGGSSLTVALWILAELAKKLLVAGKVCIAAVELDLKRVRDRPCSGLHQWAASNVASARLSGCARFKLWTGLWGQAPRSTSAARAKGAGQEASWLVIEVKEMLAP
jgi:hypothetical protein